MLKKFTLNSFFTKDSARYFQFILLVLSAGVIYPLVYLRTNFQTPIVESFGISISQLNDLYAILGLMFVFGYIPSGWLADKISARILLFTSLFITGLVGMFFAQIPDSKYLGIIFFIWGIATVFTFWGALMRSVKMLAKKDEQSRFFGILDGGRGVVEAVLATIAMGIFSFIMKKNTGNSSKEGLILVIYMYSSLCMLLSFLILIFLDKDSKINNPNINEQKITRNIFSDAKKVLSIKEVWILSAIIFCGYTLYWSIYFISGFLQSKHGVSVIVAGYVTVIVLWMRPIGGILGGILGDKINRFFILIFALIVGSIGLLIVSFVQNLGSDLVVFAFVVIIGLMLYVIRGVYWSLLDCCNIPLSILGFAIGIISFLGYLPDIFAPLVSGKIFSMYPDVAKAYTVYFVLSAGFGLLGAVLTYYLSMQSQNKQDK